MILGVYIHIPFCRRKCDYCSFYSIPIRCISEPSREALIEEYLSKLIHEIEIRSRELTSYDVDTIYFGGGTPSFLKSSQINIILEKIRDCLSVNEGDIELTIECNPDDMTVERITEYIDLGFTRVVLGVQTLNERLNKVMGRSSLISSEEQLLDFFSIDNIVHCIDLIIGIPGQTGSELMIELNRITEYRPEHISLYSLNIESGTILHNRIGIPVDLEDHQRGLFEVAIALLKDNGYIHYEVSNFALPSFESKHNLKYWKFMPYIGFGAGAHSFYFGERFYSPPSLKGYFENNGLSIVKDERTQNSEAVEYIITGMRLLSGISLIDLKARIGLSMYKELNPVITRMIGMDYLSREARDGDDILKFTPKGFFLMDSLIYELVEPIL